MTEADYRKREREAVARWRLAWEERGFAALLKPKFKTKERFHNAMIFALLSGRFVWKGTWEL